MKCIVSDKSYSKKKVLQNPSPLRYPGGKSRLAGFISLVIKNLGLKDPAFIEPFAGGSGVALSLLLNGVVKCIVINDSDMGVYSFWLAVRREYDDLIKMIEDTPITIEEWYKQRHIYQTSTSYSLDLAFATLFLNRTNRSGILTAGPIGGQSQTGKWKIDKRFNKKAIIAKIKSISEKRDNILVLNDDVFSLLESFAHTRNAFIYLDPPYYDKGRRLYREFFTCEDHKRLRDVLIHKITTPWIETYDNVKEIADLYNDTAMRRFDLTYSVANKGTATELMLFSDIRSCPTQEQLMDNKIVINLRK